MTDRQHADQTLFVEQFIDDAVRPSAGREATFVLEQQRLTEPAWVGLDGVQGLQHGRRDGDW